MKISDTRFSTLVLRNPELVKGKSTSPRIIVNSVVEYTTVPCRERTCKFCFVIILAVENGYKKLKICVKKIGKVFLLNPNS